MLDPKTNFPEASIYSIVERLDTPDDRTVVLHLRSPWADAVANLFVGGQDGSIVPEHVLKNVDDLNRSPFEAMPVGSGPYEVVKWERGSRLTLRANPGYFRGKPHVERIEFHYVADQNTLGIQVTTGELDFSPQIPVQFASRFTRHAETAGSLGDDVRRQRVALQYARRAVHRSARAPRARLGARPQSLRQFGVSRLRRRRRRSRSAPAAVLSPRPSERPGGDPPAARRLLDAAGFKPGADGVRRKDGVPLAFALSLYSGYPTLASMAVQMQAMWRAVGADVSVPSVPANVMNAPVTGQMPHGDFAAALVTDGYATTADRADTLTTSGLPPSGRNYCATSTPTRPLDGRGAGLRQ